MGKRKRKHSKVIRFGIGNPAKNAFAVWRLWVQGAEVYLAVRTSIQQMKASLHSSGKWSFRLSNRQGFTVNRPHPFMPGITRGPGVIYAGGLIERPMQGMPTEGQPEINWFDVPDPGRKTSFTVLFTEKSITQNDLMQALKPPPVLLGPLSLRNDEHVWLGVLEEELQKSEYEIIVDIKDKIAINVKESKDSMMDAHAIMVQTTDNDEIVFLGILLSKENIFIEN